MSDRLDTDPPARGLGRYYTNLPFPLQDLSQARDHLERAIKHSPKSAINLYFMADLERQEGHVDRARERLNQVIALDPNTGDVPSTRRHQELARQMRSALK